MSQNADSVSPNADSGGRLTDDEMARLGLTRERIRSVNRATQNADSVLPPTPDEVWRAAQQLSREGFQRWWTREFAAYRFVAAEQIDSSEAQS